MDKKALIAKCITMIDEQEIIDFTAELVKTKSFPPNYNERNIAVIVAKKLSDYGIDSQIDDLPGENRANLVASIGSAAHPHLAFGGHFDTVPPVESGWNYDPFGATIEDGLMYGRGTGDMKGGVASLIMAMTILKKADVPLKGKLTYIGTAGEEVDLYGARAYHDKYGCDDIDAMVIAEASNRGIFSAEKGALWLRFTTYGKAAHPGVAWEGVNALTSMLKFYEGFRDYPFEADNHPLLGSSILNITTMHAGDITNALPITCKSTVDIRTIPGVSHERIIQRVEDIIAGLQRENPDFKMDYEVLNNNAPIETDWNDPLCQAAEQAHLDVFGTEIEPSGIFYYTDAVAMPKSDGSFVPLLIYGPGNAVNNHKVNEYVPVDQLIDSTKYYIGLAIQYLT